MYHAVYIHVPFCQSKCLYCDFPSYPQYFPQYTDEYLQALTYEIESSEIQLAECATLFIGGGTPSLLAPVQLEKIFTALYKKGWQFSESSIEVNPGTINREKLECMHEMKINRLSFGVQSFDDKLLGLLGRIHTAKQAKANISLAQEVGFDNINLDLMYGLPQQTLAQVEFDLEQAARLNTTHISSYALKIEPDTKLDILVNQGKIQTLSDDLADSMYDLIPLRLAEYGLKRYEISNYARPGYECRHNQVYWHYQPYKAFGVAGCSFNGNSRTTNTFSLPDYLAAAKQNLEIPYELEELTIDMRRAEYLFMNLRLTNGFSPEIFKQVFNEDIYIVYRDVLTKYLNNNLLQILPNGNISLTSLGIKYSNIVFGDLL